MGLHTSTIIAIIKRNGGTISTSSTSGVRGWKNYTTGFVVRKAYEELAEITVRWQNASHQSQYTGKSDLEKCKAWIEKEGYRVTMLQGALNYTLYIFPKAE